MSQFLNVLGGGFPAAGSASFGNVDGPASSTDFAIPNWNGTTGTLLRNSVLITDANGDLQMPSIATLGLQLYNTVDQTTNFERLEMLWSGNSAFLRTINGGSGVLRNLVLRNGTTGNFLQMSASATVSGTFQFGATGSNAQPGAIGYNFSGHTSTAISGSNTGASIALTYNQASGSAANTDLKIARTETALGSGVQAFVQCFAGAAGATERFTILSTGKQSVYAGVVTTGWGSPAIYSSGRVTAQAAANASIATYTVGVADGSFRISANMNVTASTTLITTLTCTYTDESNTARTLVLPVSSLNGTMVAAGAITGAGASVWHTPVVHIRCKAATAITILTSVGTFTGVTYTAEGCIEQIA